jgi:hypothetical protein
MEPTDHSAVMTIYRGTPWEAEIVRTLLADAGIDSFIRNNILAGYLYDPIRAEAVEVMIMDKDTLEAKAIVDQFERNRTAETSES